MKEMRVVFWKMKERILQDIIFGIIGEQVWWLVLVLVMKSAMTALRMYLLKRVPTLQYKGLIAAALPLDTSTTKVILLWLLE